MTSPTYCIHLFLAEPIAEQYASHIRCHTFNYIIYKHNSEVPLTHSMLLSHRGPSLQQTGENENRDILLCDTDRLLEQACRIPCPRIAVSHSANKGESLMSCPWLICSPEALNEHFLNQVWCRYHKYPISILETERCILRELTLSDLPGLMKLQEENDSDPSACFFPPELFPEEAEKYLNNYINQQYPFYGYGYYGILLRQPAEHPLIGIIGLSATATEDREEETGTEIGYALLEKYQGRGICSEILPALLQYIQFYYSPDPVVARIRRDNIASIRLASKNLLDIILTDP